VNMVFKRLPLVLAMAAIALTGACKGQESASDKVFGQRVRTYLLAHPEVLQEVADAYNAKQQAQATSLLKAAVSQHRAQIENDPMDYVANPNGKVTVVEFFDFRCGYCKQIAPEVIKLIAANPDVRFVFKDFPIFGAQSDEAAAIALAAKDQRKYLSLYTQFFQAQDLTEADLRRIVSAEGLNFDGLKAKASDPAIAAHLTATHELAKAIGMDGTPQFVIDGNVVQGANLPALKAAIEKAKA
jgi:protein-disulfide isomerase